mgnify:CR=1 FL=1
MLKRPPTLPTLAELEASGAVIGEIRVVARNIFDTADPAENLLLFRWANTLHIETRADVVRRALLFKSGDGKFNSAGWIMSTIGAMILIWGYLTFGK